MSKSCDCCDHPLQHAIRQAIAWADNMGAHGAIEHLKTDLLFWEEDQEIEAETRRAQRDTMRHPAPYSH